MRVLIDTNVLISLEDDKEIEDVFAQLVRLSSGKHELLVHPEAQADIGMDRDKRRATITRTKLAKYKPLERPPVPSSSFLHQFAPSGRHNDIVDAHLLFAVLMNAVQVLVTNDYDLIRRARIAGVEDRVYEPFEAVRLLSTLDAPEPPRHTVIEGVPVHDLNLQDHFFDSFREDYRGFDQWFAKIARGGRRCYVLREDGKIQALMIYKDEPNPDTAHIPPNVFKIASLKVGDEVRGHKVGELFLKLAFHMAFNRGLRGTYVTVLPKYEALIALFEEFGFERVGEKPDQGRGEELVFYKPLEIPTGELERSPVDTVRTLYPRFVDGARVRKFLVPIQPEFHDRLFPEVRGHQMRIADYADLITEGNTIRKAYLSRSAISSIVPGALLLFYRSKDSRAITSIGVVEQVERCAIPEEVLARVGKRSVYSAGEVAEMCKKGNVLVLLFWHVTDLPRSPKYEQMHKRGILAGPPQSIQEMSHEDFQFVKEVAELDKRIAID